MSILEPITVAERYARATRSSDLGQSAEHQTDADVLIAAGIAASGNQRKILALAIYRLGVTGDMSGIHPIVEACDGWMAGHLSRKGNRPMPRAARRALIVDVLGWYMHPRCDYCGGTGVIAEEGTAGRMTSACTGCHGSGMKPLERQVPRAHVQPAQWLADQIQQYAAVIHSEMARLLGKSLDLKP